MRICLSGHIYLPGEAPPISIQDLAFEVVLCCVGTELRRVISISKCGNDYFKWTLFFSLNRLNSVVGSCHFFNCINYLLHTSAGTVQLVRGKLIIAACFKSVLHPGLTTLSHFLAEMKELGERSGAVVTDAGLRCKRGLKPTPPYLQRDPVRASNTRFLRASAWEFFILARFRTFS